VDNLTTSNNDVSAVAGSASQLEEFLSPNFNLSTAHAAAPVGGGLQTPSVCDQTQHSEHRIDNNGLYIRTKYGFAAESIPFVETVSPQIRKNIVEGEDVTLA